MMDETLDLLRRFMIDQALEGGDRETFNNLTGPNWRSFVVNADDAYDNVDGLLAFLTEDPHFWDMRLIDTMGCHPYLNYRFRDYIDGCLYVGEIRIPIGWNGDVESKFRPRPSSGPCGEPPEWFHTLLTTVNARLH